MKYCPKCKLEKDFSEFPKRSSNKDELYSYCKMCKSNDDKKYRDKYSEKLKEKKAIYRIKNRETLNRKLREYQQSEIGQEKYKQYREANKELVRMWNRNFYEKHKEKRTKLNNEYKKKHKEQYKVYYLKNKAKRRGYGEATLPNNVISDMLYQQNNKCFYCKNELGDYHIDHIIPLSKGGKHKEYNLVVTCPKCNLSKSAKYPDEFINKLKEAI